MVFLAKVKAYGFAISAALLAVLAFFVRIALLKNKVKKLKVRAESAEAQANHARVVAKADNEIEEQTTSRRVDALNEIREKNTSTELSDPNDWVWVNEDDSGKE